MASKRKSVLTQSYRILSWNIGGLDDYSWRSRCAAICDEILRVLPDTILLQELVSSFEPILKSRLSPLYTFIIPQHQPASYYLGILLRKSTMNQVSQPMYYAYPNSQMGRGLLGILCTYHKQYNISIFTSHLESLSPHSEVRKEQYKCVLKRMRQSEESLCVFGGDLNIRVREDKAVRKKKDLPLIHDLYEYMKEPAEHRYTWDQQTNTIVKEMCKDRSSSYTCRMRFDRLLCRLDQGRFVPQRFELVGTTTFPLADDSEIHPSDHYGILGIFHVDVEEENVYLNESKKKQKIKKDEQEQIDYIVIE